MQQQRPLKEEQRGEVEGGRRKVEGGVARLCVAIKGRGITIIPTSPPAARWNGQRLGGGETSTPKGVFGNVSTSLATTFPVHLEESFGRVESFFDIPGYRSAGQG